MLVDGTSFLLSSLVSDRSLSHGTGAVSSLVLLPFSPTDTVGQPGADVGLSAYNHAWLVIEERKDSAAWLTEVSQPVSGELQKSERDPSHFQ